VDATADATPDLDGLLDPEWLSELVRALDRDEFAAYYQPQVRMENGAIVGAEALLRWEHPQHGVIGPDHFIGALEASGLIVPVGLRVLWLACYEARSWNESGLGELMRRRISAHSGNSSISGLRSTALLPSKPSRRSAT
jgi:EAL domain-containing protein (putative c-di-GMP-specific phosphodiesterase class I)